MGNRRAILDRLRHWQANHYQCLWVTLTSSPASTRKRLRNNFQVLRKRACRELGFAAFEYVCVDTVEDRFRGDDEDMSFPVGEGRLRQAGTRSALAPGQSARAPVDFTRPPPRCSSARMNAANCSGVATPGGSSPFLRH